MSYSKQSDPGTLVILDGLDGSGKSTLVQALSVALGGSATTRTFAFPSKDDNEVGRLIRRVFADPTLVCEEAMLYLFVADALVQQRRMRAYLDMGMIVLCDRHPVTSGPVYNVTRDRDLLTVGEITQIEQFIIPDAVFVVDVPVEVAEARIAARNGKTGEARNLIYERELEVKRARYLKLVGMGEGLVEKLDGTRTTEDLVAELVPVIREIAARKLKTT